MQITAIAIRRAVKVNIGNYENTDFAIELTASIEAGESIEIARGNLAMLVNQAIENQLVDFFKAQEEAKDTKATTTARKKASRYSALGGAGEDWK